MGRIFDAVSVNGTNLYTLFDSGDKEMWRIFINARNVLHIDGFWDRDPVFERVKVVLKDIKEYIDGIEGQRN